MSALDSENLAAMEELRKSIFESEGQVMLCRPLWFGFYTSKVFRKGKWRISYPRRFKLVTTIDPVLVEKAFEMCEFVDENANPVTPTL